MMRWVVVGITLIVALAVPGCALERPPDPVWVALSQEQQTAVYKYVACVNSRFPLDANRWAFVSEETVANELAEGRLDFAGMGMAYRSLGCGQLEAQR